MGCLIVIVAFAAPRVTMIFIALLTDWFARAFETALWPVLGWFLLPYTTLAYMAAMLNKGQISGGWLVLLIAAVLVDIGVIGGSGAKH